jgi:hypothetical protein
MEERQTINLQFAQFGVPVTASAIIPQRYLQQQQLQHQQLLQQVR